jgi:hypothetical protein
VTSPAEDIATFLDSQGFGTYVAGGTIIVGDLRPTPDVLTAVRDSPGYPNVEAMSEIVFVVPGVQISVRDPDWVTAYQRAFNMWKACAQAHNVTLNGTRYCTLTPAQMPFQMPDDGTATPGRVTFVFNLNAWCDPK